MEELISFQNNLLGEIPEQKRRYLYSELDNKERLIGLQGLRGTGKTTMLLQYLKEQYTPGKNGLYVTADHPYFYNHSLLDTASTWYSYGGELLLIDEVHKYPDWQRELKLIYDGHPKLRTIFTSSSAIDVYRGSADLSRRLYMLSLPGLSFREYLYFVHNMEFKSCTLDEIFQNHANITSEITKRVKILPLFKKYLNFGYFPFALDIEDSNLPARLLRVITTVLESDLAYTEHFNITNVQKIKKLLGVIAESAPFEPNIAKIAEKLQLGRNTVNTYLKNLRDARILNLLHENPKGISKLQKPDKIFFENSNFARAFQSEPETGTKRETFLAGQIINAGLSIKLHSKADFVLGDRYVVEVGGKNKTHEQIKGETNAYLAKDEVEHGFAQTVPLWLFGFLY